MPIVILTSTNASNVASNAKLDEDIIQRREVGRVQASDGIETSTQADVLGYGGKSLAEDRQGKGLGRHRFRSVITVEG